MSEVSNCCHTNEGEFEKICGKEDEEMKNPCRGNRNYIYTTPKRINGKLTAICDFCGRRIRLAVTTGKLYPHSELPPNKKQCST